MTETYLAKLRRLADGALRSAFITPEKKQWWDGYRQALDDIGSAPRQP